MSGDSVALVNYPAWRAQGACRNENPSIFYPERGELVAFAQELCAVCPVLLECRQWGIEHEKHGIWGGTSERERRRIRRRLGIHCSAPEEQADSDEWKHDRAVALFRQGWDAHEIAAELGQNLRTVHRWLDDAVPAIPPPDGRKPRRRPADNEPAARRRHEQTMSRSSR